MAATATQDDDLLIISDENEEDSGDIDFSFDFWGDDDDVKDEKNSSDGLKIEDKIIITEESSDEEAELSLKIDSEESIAMQKESVEEEIVVEEIQEEKSEDEDEVSLDIENLEVESEVQEVEEISPDETPNGDDTVSFDLDLEEDVEEEAWEESTAEDEVDLWGFEMWKASSGDNRDMTESSMNAILSLTIAQLDIRKENIAKEIAEKKEQETELKAQIEQWKVETETLEGEIEVLNAESKKIDENNAQLEGMKLDPVKEHNAKRVAKKK